MPASRPRTKETNVTLCLPSICLVGSDTYPVLNPSYGGRHIGGESVQQTLLAREFVSRGFLVSLIDIDYGQPIDRSIHGISILKTFRKDAEIPVLRFLHPRITSIPNTSSSVFSSSISFKHLRPYASILSFFDFQFSMSLKSRGKGLHW